MRALRRGGGVHGHPGRAAADVPGPHRGGGAPAQGGREALPGLQGELRGYAAVGVVPFAGVAAPAAEACRGQRRFRRGRVVFLRRGLMEGKAVAGEKTGVRWRSAGGRLGEVNKWWLQTLLFLTVPFTCLETLLFWLARYF